MYMYISICLYLSTFKFDQTLDGTTWNFGNTGCDVCLLDNLRFTPIRETTNLLSFSCTCRIFSGNIQTSMRASFLHCVKIWIH